MTYRGLILVAGAAFALTACGSSSSSSGGGSAGGGSLPAEYADLEGLVAAGEAGELTAASADMTTGTATLSGGFGVGDLGDDESMELIGDMSLTADFDQGNLTGSADNFALYDQDTSETIEDITGSLAIAGTITGTDLSANASGVLSDDEDHPVDMTMTGGFYDYGGNLVAYGENVGTIDGEQYEGGFAAIQD